MVRLKDIAEKTGYSISVVSRALKSNIDKSDTTSKRTKEYIRKIAKKMGYSSNINASLLRRGRTPAIGVFLPPYSSSLVADLVFGLSEASMECRYPLFYAPGYTVEAFSQFLENSKRMSSAGIIIYFAFNNMLDEPDYQEKVRKGLSDKTLPDSFYEYMRRWNQELYDAVTLFAGSGGKVVLFNEIPINYDYESLGIRSVCCNDRVGGETAAEYLLKCNCQSFVCIRNWNRCSYDRFRFFSNCLVENGQKCTDVDFFEPKELRGDEYLSSYLDKVFTVAKAPVGIFITSDTLLLEVYNYCRNRNFEIGKDIKIVSYNNQEFVSHLSPAVTSIRQPMREAGKAAMYKMVEMLNEKNVKSELIEPELIIR
jgi:LacI family transcriptional regulator, galactose operon repressor